MPDVDHEIISLPAPRSVSFSKEVRPILNNRCVVCHGCYDAPCQLKLSSYEGLERGASKSVVYDGARLNPVEPTRLFVDAKSKKEWRSKGFYSVLNESSHESYRDNLEKSVFYRMIQMKQRQPQPRTGAVAKELGPNLNRQNYCPTQEELPHFMEQHSNWGMPFGLPNLTEREYETLVLWLAQGAQTDQKATLLKKAERKSLNAWEQLLNQKDLKSQLISRYLYEHLFLAHIQFVQFDKRRFYRLVRSRTPSGNPVDEIATVRPYDSPGVGALYYRFVEESSAIVAKNHLVYKLGPQTYKRWKSLFYDKDFQVTALPSYDVDQASNPFRTFTQIPA
ncbi:MAG: fatty acid cis/trans isomerase [Bdellovibrionales bacterium]|nr:fatty acid cis/trans isomerase [Bdellovibrionales bacterium]